MTNPYQPGGYPPGPPQQGYPPAPQQGYPPAPQQGYPPAPQPGLYQQPTQVQPAAWPQPQYQPQPMQGYGPPPQQGYYGAPGPQPGYAPGPQPGYAPGPQTRPTNNDPMAGVEDADPTGSRLPHFNPERRYVVRNTAIAYFEGRKANFVNAEFDILESDDPLLQAGRSAKYMIKWDQDMSFPNFKAMIGAMLGMTDAQQIKDAVNKQMGLDAIGPGQPFKGKIVELRTTATKTRANTDFTVHNWAPVAGAAAPMTLPQQAPQAWGGPPQVPQQAPPVPQQSWGGPPPVPQQAPQQWGAPPQAAPALGAPPPWGGAPPQYAPPMNTAPGFAPMGAPPAPEMPFPPPGWYPHPQQPGVFHNTKEMKTEADLRELQRMGRA